jgi:hypothetical protein
VKPIGNQAHVIASRTDRKRILLCAAASNAAGGVAKPSTRASWT